MPLICIAILLQKYSGQGSLEHLLIAEESVSQELCVLFENIKRKLKFQMVLGAPPPLLQSAVREQQPLNTHNFGSPSGLVTGERWTGSPNKSIDQIGKKCPKCPKIVSTFPGFLSTFPFSGLPNDLPVENLAPKLKPSKMDPTTGMRRTAGSGPTFRPPECRFRANPSAGSLPCLEDRNLLKLRSLDLSCPLLLSDTSIRGPRTQTLQMLWSQG